MEEFSPPEGNRHDLDETIVDQMHRAQTAAREQLEALDRTFRDIVASQPLAAMGVALAFGFLVGRLLRR